LKISLPFDGVSITYYVGTVVHAGVLEDVTVAQLGVLDEETVAHAGVFDAVMGVHISSYP